MMGGGRGKKQKKKKQEQNKNGKEWGYYMYPDIFLFSLFSPSLISMLATVNDIREGPLEKWWGRGVEKKFMQG